jgi:hypothetical protein
MNTKFTKWLLIFQMSVCTIFQMAIKYINTFQSKALQNLPKIRSFVLKIHDLATLGKTQADYILGVYFILKPLFF